MVNKGQRDVAPPGATPRNTQPVWRNWQTRRIQNPTSSSTSRNDVNTSDSIKTAISATASNAPKIEFSGADLRMLIDAWPALPPALRAGMVAMVRAALEGHETRQGGGQ